ncbi:hypothetical protein PENTCL1PPCAC_16419, partial [Pristionchus entomophagus]
IVSRSLSPLSLLLANTELSKLFMESSLSPSFRCCLICGAQTTSCHYGVDACRACTVFYRKARKKRLYACRWSTKRCTVREDGTFTCKRCRFDRFEQILRMSGANERLEKKAISQRITDLPSIPTPNIPPSQVTARPLLEKCALIYKMLSAMRRNSELNARPNPPHPSKINEEEYDILPCTYETMESSSRFLITGILDMACMLFPEYETLSKDEKWILAVNFYNRFYSFEAFYRADKKFSDDMDKMMGAYTSFLSVDVIDHFFDNCPNQRDNVEDAKSVFKKFISPGIPTARLAIRRANLDESEFLAILILTFWFSDCLYIRDEIVRIGERYRHEILRELQAYYREDLNMKDYAVRIGELFMLILNFDVTVLT